MHLLKALAYVEIPKLSATVFVYAYPSCLPDSLDHACSAFPSNAPQLFWAASGFLIGGTDKDKWAPVLPLKGYVDCHKCTEHSPYFGLKEENDH